MIAASSSGNHPSLLDAARRRDWRIPGRVFEGLRPEGPPSHLEKLGGLLLIVLVVVAFFPAFDIYLIGDDFEWLTAAFEIPHDPLSSFDRINSMCRPVVKWSFLADYLVFGKSAWGYMFTNLAIHTLNVFLLYLLLARIVRLRLLAVGAAAAFALSPLHSEAVLWASSRGDTLLLTSWLGVLLLLLAQSRDPSWLQRATVMILVLFGAGAKESWVVFPLIATAFLVLVLGQRVASAALKLRWVWLVLVLYLCVIVVLPAVLGATTAAYYANASPMAALTKMSRLLLTYLGLGAFQLSAAHAVWLAGAVTAAVVTFFLRVGNRRGLWTVIWTVTTLALAAPFSDTALRHNYLPLAGFWMTVAVLSDELVVGKETRVGHNSRHFRQALFAVGVVAILVFEGLLLQREIDDYRYYADVHRQLANALDAVEPKLPRDQPLLFVNNGKRKAVEESIDQLQGVEKTFFLRRDAPWQLVYLPSLVNFLGRPFVERLHPIRADEISAANSGGFTVLMFDDREFRITTETAENLRYAIEASGRLSDTVSWYRFEPY